MREPLQDEVERLYVTFAAYHRSPRMSGCPHCDLGDRAFTLHQTALNAATWDDFGVYPFKALTTFGELHDFKHFLPRMLELLTRSEPHYHIEVILGKLGYARLIDWPPVEQEAVKRSLVSIWQLALSQEDEESLPWLNVGSVLCGIAGTGLPIQPFLGIWEDQSQVQKSLHLARFVQENMPDIIKKKRLMNSYYEPNAKSMVDIMNWLKHDSLHEGLLQAFDRARNEEEQSLILDAYDNLRAWKSPEA